MINYLFYKISIFLSMVLPLKAAYAVATRLADVHFFISKKDRTTVIENMCAVTGMPVERVRPIARSVFRNFAKYLVDFFRFEKLDQALIERMIRIEGIEHFDAALKKGNGVVLVSAHLGNWELGGVLLAKLGYTINALVLDHKTTSINDIFVHQRSMCGVQVVSINAMMRRCVSALKANQALAVVGDRDFGSNGIEIEFLGRKAVIPKGAATFCLRCESPIVPVFMLRNPDDTFTMKFEAAIAQKRTGKLHDDIVAITKATTNVLERYIQKYPDQWCMFRRFWV